MTEKNRKAKVSGPRTEVFALRLDPKLKYLAEIAARKQRRSLANFVEWAIDEALKGVPLADGDINGNGATVANMATRLWALDEPERLRNLAKRISKFMTEKYFDIELVRACWSEIKAYALEGGALEKLNEAICLHDDIPF